MISVLISIAFAGYIAYVAQPGSSLFSWHPTLMSLAFGVFVAQAVQALSPGGLFGSASRSRKVTYHWLLMIGGVVSALLGFTAIYFTKEKSGKEHFTTPHGQLGCVVIVYLLVQSCAGINVLFPTLAKKFVPIGLLKRAHGFSGVFLFLLATLVLLGGLTTDWFKERVPVMVWFMCLITPFVLWGLLLKQVLQSQSSAKKEPVKKAT